MALVVVCLGQLMMVVDMTIVNVALPVIQRDLRFSQADLTWVVGAYLISYGSFLLLAGRLGDLIGRKHVFLAGAALFTVASLACGLAESQFTLIAARFVQGIGGAIATSVIIALIVTDFPRVDERVKAMGAYMFVVTSGGSLGLLLGGALVQSVDWHWIFTVNVPIGIAVLALGARLIENRPGLGLRSGIDVAGSMLMTAAMMIAVYAIVTAAEYGWASAHTLGFGGAAAILVAAFFYPQARIANPILPLRILRVRSLIGAIVVRGFLVTGMFGTWVMGSLYVEHVLGYGAWATGLAFLPMTLIVGALSLGTTARVMARLGPERTVVVGLVLVVGALALLSGVDETTGYFPTLFVAFALMGLGIGTAMLPLLTIAMSGVPGGRRSRERDHQRLDAARGRARDRHARHARGGSLGRAHQRRRERADRAHRRLQPGVRGRRRSRHRRHRDRARRAADAARARACPRLRGRRRGLTASAAKPPPARTSGRRRRTRSASPPARRPRRPARRG